MSNVSQILRINHLPIDSVSHKELSALHWIIEESMLPADAFGPDIMREFIIEWLKYRNRAKFRNEVWNIYRSYDPFHCYDHDHNTGRISSITPEVFNFFIKFPECLTCTVNKLPRPCTCAKHSICELWAHCHMNKNKEDKYLREGKMPLITVETNRKKKTLGIHLSRMCLVLNAHYTVDLDFIFRNSKAYSVTLHHKNGDHSDDSSYENYAIVDTKWHLSRSLKLFHAKRKLDELEAASTMEGREDPNIKRVLQKKEEIENELLNVSHDDIFYQLLIFGFLLRKGVYAL